MTEHYHFIGIGGIGMSALAHILLDNKSVVTGSDLALNASAKQLIEKGARIEQGHSAQNVAKEATIVYSSAVQQNNPEYQQALALQCPMIHRSELLAHLLQEQQSYAVAGTHGKTTTSSLLTHVLKGAQLDPSYAIGGLLEGHNGYKGRGGRFVFEADESDGSFLRYHPTCAIVTNVEAEHLDYYGDENRLKEAFKTFMDQVKELLFYCGDDSNLREMAKGVSYGFDKQCDLHIAQFRQQGWSIEIDLTFEGRDYLAIKVPLIGRHNALNAAAVFGLALKLGIDEAIIRSALSTFPGVDRRCQFKKEMNQILMLDDYAHHPTEIKTTLAAIKSAVEERRVVVLFQPHRFNRTQNFLKEFTRAFDDADLLFVTDIYPGPGEKPIEGISGEALLLEIQKATNLPCHYLPKSQWSQISALLRPHDVFVTMGAGDVTYFHRDLNPSTKHQLGLVFGGLSCEHEISLRSSRFVGDSLDPDLYDIHRFYIDREGNWTVNQQGEAKSLLSSEVAQALAKCEIFFPVLHGPYGEDGTMQGFFELLQKPYVGPDHCSAAVSMNKMLSKIIAASKGVLTPNAIAFNYHQWKQQRESWLQQSEELLFPIFVKPIHLGSSVGISKVYDKEALEQAIDNAFRFDTDVMLEEGKENCREIEFAVMGNPDGFQIRVPVPGEKLAEGSVVDYEKKYGAHPVPTTTEPTFAPGVLEKGQEAAALVYRGIGNSCMTRVDFLLDQENRWWFFELNPIPGMQQLSLFPKIWRREGLSSQQLMNRLIILAIHRKMNQKRYLKPCAS